MQKKFSLVRVEMAMRYFVENKGFLPFFNNYEEIEKAYCN